MKHQVKNIFIDGPIEPAFIAEKIAAHQTKTAIGGHSIFMGQVRADLMEDKRIAAIEYTAYTDMALQMMHGIRETVIPKYQLTCMHVYHSLGKIAAGQICFFVFTSAPHRKAAIDGCSEIVERVKSELPIWGKELFDDESFQWKVNQPL
ncbi:MAG TPA: molybdenum cofactor biosynthesis protein MoaE [Puia sp.]|nr:molybdenum cofactor biosynthesis protein MoaE [Puia sp.]